MGRLTHRVMLVSMLAAACSNPARPSQGSMDINEVPTGPNTLTDAERGAGWQLLFDGYSMTGWRGFRQPGVPAGWQAIDGALTRVSGGGDVITTDQFSNFELALQWQIGEGGNSGIMYRVSEAVEATFLSGPEFQVIDNARNPDGGTALTSAAACYGLYAPSSDVTRPAGSWNHARIIVNGTHVEHWLNEVKVVDYELGSADWLARVQASMFRGVSTYGGIAADTSPSRTTAIGSRTELSKSGRCHSSKNTTARLFTGCTRVSTKSGGSRAGDRVDMHGFAMHGVHVGSLA